MSRDGGCDVRCADSQTWDDAQRIESARVVGFRGDVASVAQLPVVSPAGWAGSVSRLVSVVSEDSVR